MGTDINGTQAEESRARWGWLAPLWPAVRLLLILTVVSGIIYPLAVTEVAQTLMPYQANGSQVHYRGRLIGSILIGQAFTQACYFQGRPSATGYNAASSGASNLGPTNPALVKQVRNSMEGILSSNPGVSPAQVPADLVESSDSGIDPDITPAAARLQVARLSRLDHVSAGRLRQLVRAAQRGRFLGIFGHSYVNVLKLNLALKSVLASSGGVPACGGKS